MVVAERRVMSRDWSGMIYLLCLLDVDEERLELRCLGIRVAHERRQGVGQKAVLGDALEAPMYRNAHVVDGLTVDLERLNALGHHRHRLDEAPVGPHLHPVAVLDALLFGQLLADFHELLRLHDGRQPGVLGPVVEVLGEAVGGAGVRVVLALAEGLQVALEHPRRRIADHFRVQRVGVDGASRKARSAQGTVLPPSCPGRTAALRPPGS